MLNLFLVLAFAVPPPTPACVAPDGALFRLELAITSEEKARGLMYRDSLSEDAGMLFVFDQDGRLSFWMKDTVIPLDMVWLAADGTVVDVRTVQPCRMEPCPTYAGLKLARAVLELNAGLASKHGIKPGTVLRFERVPGYPLAGNER